MTQWANLLVDFESELIVGDNTIDTTGFEELCGIEWDSDPWVPVVHAVGARLCNVSDAWAEVGGIFDCRTWYPLYTTAVHDTLCFNVDVFAWIAFTQFFVVSLAFIVLTCRVIIYQGMDEIEMEEVQELMEAVSNDAELDRTDNNMATGETLLVRDKEGTVGSE